MRTEYTIVRTDNKGKKHYSVYAKAVVFDRYEKYKSFYEQKGEKVELFKVRYNGSSFYDSEKIN